MSVRLTLRLRPGQKCSVDSIPQPDHSCLVTVDLSDDDILDARAPIAHRNGPAGGQQQAVYAANNPQSGNVLEKQEGSAMINQLGQNQLGCSVVGQNQASSAYANLAPDPAAA